MYKFKIITKDKYMKKPIHIKEPHSQRVGKIDCNDIMQSSLPPELYMAREGFKKLKTAKRVAITYQTTVTIYLEQL